MKDRNSIWIASLSRRTAYRNPDLEAAIIKATSHDESRVDYKNAQRVFAWIRTSPTYLKPLVWALSMRMEKTRSWVVALKGLMLMHGVFCCKIPAVQKIGRLPFDLSNFKDGHSSPENNPSKTWGYNAFVRAYFAFLDQKSSLLCLDYSHDHTNNQNSKQEEPLVQQLIKLQQWQSLLDMLLQVKPHIDGTKASLILEAMDCVIIEIFDVYSKICSGIARVLMRIYAAGKVEAAMALRVLQKATTQGEELSLYFEFCLKIGVLNASECPKVEHIPEEDIRELERIINGVSEKTIMPHDEDKALHTNGGTKAMKTIITEKWEVFDEDFKLITTGQGTDLPHHVDKPTTITQDPFAASLIFPPSYNQGIPDLISFV